LKRLQIHLKRVGLKVYVEFCFPSHDFDKNTEEHAEHAEYDMDQSDVM
jgi:hypothetical protein